MKTGYIKVSKSDINDILELQIGSFKKAGVEQNNLYIDKCKNDASEFPKLESCLKSLSDNDTLVVWNLNSLGVDIYDLIKVINNLADKKINVEILNCKGVNINANHLDDKNFFAIFASLADFKNKKDITKNKPKTKTINKTNSFEFYIDGLTSQEQSMFEKVFAFKSALGIPSHLSKSSSSAKLIISTKPALSKIKTSSEQMIVLVIENIQNINDLADLKIKRPLTVSSVTKIINEAIKLLPEKAKTHHNKKVTLPNNSSSQKNVSDGALTKNNKSNEIKGHHALIIDDSILIHTQLRIELENSEITADYVTSGEEALKLALEGKYDLIFLDVMMPGIDGYETCERLRSIRAYKKTPIIMLSGKTSPLDEVKGVMVGATTYLSKPIVSSKFQETLNRIVKWLDNFSK